MFLYRSFQATSNDCYSLFKTEKTITFENKNWREEIRSQTKKIESLGLRIDKKFEISFETKNLKFQIKNQPYIP